MQANLTEEQREVITGTSQICTMNNQPIYIIEGDPLNFKLTTDGDLLILNRSLMIRRYRLKGDSNEIINRNSKDNEGTGSA